MVIAEVNQTEFDRGDVGSIWQNLVWTWNTYIADLNQKTERLRSLDCKFKIRFSD